MSRTHHYFDLVSGRSRGPIAFMGRSFLALLSGGYAIGVTVRNRQFETGFRPAQSAEVPVISIGNVTTGGTGKTPMVEYVARYLRDRKNLRVAILSRGYGVDASHGGMNDEGLLLDQNLPDVPHLQDADRVALAHVAVNELESQILLLDDGLQHRRLNRDLNIVLIDATNPFGYGWVLPRGLLREPLKQGISRADVIVLTRSDLVDDSAKQAIQNKVQKLAGPGTIWVESVHKPLDLLMADGEIQPLGSIRGQKAAIFCGLGNPGAFRRTVEALGVEVIAEQFFPDHHQYTESEIGDLSQWVAGTGANLALTSQKDLVKLPVEHLGGRPLAAIRIGLAITSGEPELNQALDVIADRASSA